MTKIKEALKKYIYELEQQLAITKEALKLLGDENNYFVFVDEGRERIDVNYAILKAKENLKSE